MQALIRKSDSAASGLVYLVFTPSGLDKYLKRQQLLPGHLRDFFCLDESHRSIQDYCPAYGTGPDAPSQSLDCIFVADGPAASDTKRCMAFNAVDNIKLLLTSNRPQTTIQVTRFSDATVITMSANHAHGDLVTLKSYFKAWEQALSGQQVNPYQQLETDVFAMYGPGGEVTGEGLSSGSRKSTSPPPPPGWRVFSGLDKIRFIARHLWDYYIVRPERTIEDKRIFIPEAQMQALEDRARYDLANKPKSCASVPQENGGDMGERRENSIYVSRSDVLLAWLLKHSHTHLSPKRKSTFLTVANARFKPPTPLTASIEGLSGNDVLCAAMAIALPSLRVEEIMTISLGELALHIRRGLKTNAAPDNIKKWLVFQLHHSLWKKTSGSLALPGKPDHFMTGITDWSRIHLEDLNFAPARLNTSGTVTICGIDGHMVVDRSRRDLYVGAGCVDGGMWIVGYASTKQWRDQRGFGRYTAVRHKWRNEYHTAFSASC